MKVRATQDGTYDGYYRHGPIQSESGTIPGEVFEIKDGEWPALDQGTGRAIMDAVIGKDGYPVMERVSKQAVDGHGNPVVDEKGRAVMIAVEQPKMKARMWSWFNPEWMEKVTEQEEVTYDHPPFQIPSVYRTGKGKKTAAPTRPNQNLLPVI